MPNEKLTIATSLPDPPKAIAIDCADKPPKAAPSDYSVLFTLDWLQMIEKRNQISILDQIRRQVTVIRAEIGSSYYWYAEIPSGLYSTEVVLAYLNSFHSTHEDNQPITWSETTEHGYLANKNQLIFTGVIKKAR